VILKLADNTKGIAIGTVLGVGIGVALNNFAIGLAIRIIFSVALIQKKNNFL